MEITKDFKIAAFMAYWGSDYNTNGNIEHKVQGEPSYIRRDIVYRNAQLILTPLEDISDEHALECAKIMLPLPFQRHTGGWIVERDNDVNCWVYIKVSNPKNLYSLVIDCHLLNFNIYNKEEQVNYEHDIPIHAIIDYLRSKSYNTPFRGVDLVKAGIAVLKQKEV